MRSSRLGGVATSLPAPGTRRVGQLALGLGAPADGDLGPEASPAVPRTTRPLPDVAHVHGWLTPPEQRALVEQFREWARPPAGLRHPRVPTGHLMTVQSVCLGWHWQPYAYSRTADDTDAAPVKPLPPDLAALARRAVADTPGAGSPFEPDAAIVNLYAPGARLGLHQDGEEPSSAPVVTISLGDTCVVPHGRCRSPHRPVHRRRPAPRATCSCSGAATGGSTTASPRCSTAPRPAGLDLPPGRLSITVRETGLA